MIVVMKLGSTQEQVEHVVKRVREMGLKDHVIVGEERTVVAVIGNDRNKDRSVLETVDGVDKVVPILAPYKMASNEVKKERTRPLGLSWPRDVFSLSHVAIPFPMSDPVYGREGMESAPATIRLGLLSPRGERAVLTVPSDTLMRLTCNPFYSYLADRMAGWIP